MPRDMPARDLAMAYEQTTARTLDYVRCICECADMRSEMTEGNTLNTPALRLTTLYSGDDEWLRRRVRLRNPLHRNL
jgi:hypothetical protein